MLHIVVFLEPCFCGTHYPHLAQATAIALPATHAVYTEEFWHPSDDDTVYFLADSHPLQPWGSCPVATFLGDVIHRNEHYLRHVLRTTADEVRLYTKGFWPTEYLTKILPVIQTNTDTPINVINLDLYGCPSLTPLLQRRSSSPCTLQDRCRRYAVWTDNHLLQHDNWFNTNQGKEWTEYFS